MTLKFKPLVLFAKIILPALLSILLFVFFDFDIIYHVLFFGLIIVIFNNSKIKHSLGLSFIYSICLSYLSFFISIGFYFGVLYVIKYIFGAEYFENNYILGINFETLLFLLPFAIISPYLMFIFYKVLFRIKNNVFFKIFKYVTISILFIIGLIRNYFGDEVTSIYWQFIMIMALQLILHMKDLKKLFNLK